MRRSACRREASCSRQAMKSAVGWRQVLGRLVHLKMISLRQELLSRRGKPLKARAARGVCCSCAFRFPFLARPCWIPSRKPFRAGAINEARRVLEGVWSRSEHSKHCFVGFVSVAFAQSLAPVSGLSLGPGPAGPGWSFSACWDQAMRPPRRCEGRASTRQG